MDGELYCEPEYTGPECLLCIGAARYMNARGECADCPPMIESLGAMAAIALSLQLLAAAAVGLYQSKLQWRVLQGARRLWWPS